MTACCLIPLLGYLLISLLNKAPISLSALDLPDIIAWLLTCEWAGNILGPISTKTKTKNQLSLFKGSIYQNNTFTRCNHTGLNVNDSLMPTPCCILLFSFQRQRAFVSEGVSLSLKVVSTCQNRWVIVVRKILIILCTSINTVLKMFLPESGLQLENRLNF